MKMINLVCDFCGKEFTKQLKHYTSAVKRGQTKHGCSAVCSRKQKAVKLNCGTCNKVIIKFPSQVKNSKSGLLFCNKTCATIFNNKLKIGEKASNWKGGVSKYRENGLELVCSNCLESRYYLLVVHHKDHDRNNPSLNNLVCLCYNCHALEHLKETKTGKIVVDHDILTSENLKRKLAQLA